MNLFKQKSTKNVKYKNWFLKRIFSGWPDSKNTRVRFKKCIHFGYMWFKMILQSHTHTHTHEMLPFHFPFITHKISNVTCGNVPALQLLSVCSCSCCFSFLFFSCFSYVSFLWMFLALLYFVNKVIYSGHKCEFLCTEGLTLVASSPPDYGELWTFLSVKKKKDFSNNLNILSVKLRHIFIFLSNLASTFP